MVALVSYADVVMPDIDDGGEAAMDTGDEDNDPMTLLSATSWDEPLDVVRPLRNRICKMLKIPAPKLTGVKVMLCVPFSGKLVCKIMLRAGASLACYRRLLTLTYAQFR